MQPFKTTPWLAEVMALALQPSEAALEVAEAISEIVEGYKLTLHVDNLIARLPMTAEVGFRELAARRCLRVNARGISLVRRTLGVPGEPAIVRLLRQQRGKGPVE